MRILINSINFSPELTSTGKYTGDMAQWLADRGHAVRVVTAPPHYPAWRVFAGYSSFRYKKEKLSVSTELRGTFEIFRCPTWIPRKPRGWRRVLYLATFSLSNCPVMLAQVFWKPDLILLIEPTLSSIPQTLTTAWLSGAMSWLHVQDFEVDVAFQLTDFSSPHFRRLMHLIERWLMAKFTRVSTISTRMTERLMSKMVYPTRTVLFPNWVDTADIFPSPSSSPLRQELGITTGTIVALYAGNMGLKQGLHILIEAGRLLESRRDIRFVICGDGPYRNELVNMAGQAKNILFLPLQPSHKLNDLLNLADIHLLPQVGGAADLVMPSKLTGIMASGRAVVATANEGTEIASVLAGTGLITPPGNAHAFASAVAFLSENHDLRESMGRAARNYAIIHLSRDKILLHFEHLLNDLCSKSSQSSENGLAA